MIAAIWDTDGLDCNKCAEQIKQLRGCETETEPYYINKRAYTRCPLILIDAEISEYFNVYNLYEKGLMPTEGTYLDQTVKYIQIMKIIESNIKQKNMRDIKNGR